MQLKKSLFVLLLLVSFSKINAQNFELGKVSIAELQEKAHPKDTAAVAAILFNNGKVRFEYYEGLGLVMILEVKTKIKIYKKEGYDWANKTVSHFVGNSSEVVTFSDAVTYNIVEGKIVKTKLGKEGEFSEKIDKYLARKKIVLPNVKEGSIIEYSYTLRSPNISNMRDWYFQSSIPVNYSEYKITISDYLTYNKRTKGYIYPKVIEEKGYGQESKTTYVLKDIPALKEESFVSNIDNYMASISYELAMINIPGRIYEAFSTDWKSVTKTIYDYEDFGLELNKTGYFEEDIKGVIAGLTTPEEKIAAILNYVKTTIKWNDYLGYDCNEGVKTAYKNKIGNVAEINLMLTAMLRYSGLTANPVLVSTRSNGIALFPSTAAFNYVIAAVETSNGLVLLDASDKFSTPNVLPFRALNWIGRLIRKDGTSEEVDLMPKVASNDTVTMNYAIDESGKVSGKLRRQRTDHNAMIFRKNIEDEKEDAYLEKLENDNNKIEVIEYSRANEKDVKMPVVETFSYTGSDLCEIIGGKIYVNPLLFYTQEANPFKQENREYPVDYGFPFMDKYAVNIQIPEGYKIETLPTSSVLTMEDDLGNFRFMTSQNGNTIQLSAMVQMNSAIISSEYYPTLKEFYQKMIDKQNEKIILTKI